MEQLAHWIDNADSYICSCCKYESNNPNKEKFGPNVCPRCFSRMDNGEGKTMERLTEHHVNKLLGAYMVCSGACIDDDFDCNNCEKLAEIINCLAAYEDAMPIERAQELAQAEKDGRLVVLDELRKPLIWGDDAHASILCPECNHDLMGGFPEDEYCEKDMYQCPYCGQPIDSAKAMTREEAEATLKKREEVDNEAD